MKSFGLNCWICVVPLLLVAGCSNQPPAYPTKGKVVFPNGTPVHTGTVELRSRKFGNQARGTIAKDGTFVLSTYGTDDGAVEGLHDCVVVQFVVAEDLKTPKHSTFGVIHPRYGSYTSSGLSCEILPREDNTITLTVEGVGRLSDGGAEKDHKHK